MIVIQEVLERKQKEDICNNILRALPDWFGIETSIIEYTKEVQNLIFFVAYLKNVPIGFIALKEHNKYTSEIYVMGILEPYHRLGIGKQLIEYCQSYCCKNKSLYLTVKTVDEARQNLYYNKTRNFYYSMGFRPLEVFALFWDASNPCLLMAKYIGKIEQ